MTIEQLLLPRWQVIADYPFSQWRIGNVIMQEHDPQVSLESYPHLFKKLEWWEHRKPEEMPEYVKPNNYDSFDEVTDDDSVPVYKIGLDCEHNWYKGEYLGVKFKSGGGLLCDYVDPATSSQYDEYLKTTIK